jgi:hypothetical protein
MPARASTPVGLGVVDHRGWAVAVAVTSEQEVVERRRLELLDPGLVAMPYEHFDDDEIESTAASAARCARTALAGVQQDLAANGYRLTVVSIEAVPDDPDPKANQRTRIAADAAIYRGALQDAAADLGIDLVFHDRKQRQVDVPRPDGPPWQKDHRWAASAALAALEQ